MNTARQYINGGIWLSSNQSLFTETGGGKDLATVSIFLVTDLHKLAPFFFFQVGIYYPKYIFAGANTEAMKGQEIFKNHHEEMNILEINH